MPEEMITITIDEDGIIQVKTDGIFGEACMDTVAEILDEDIEFVSIKKTDDFYKSATTKNKNVQQIRGKQ